MQKVFRMCSDLAFSTVERYLCSSCHGPLIYQRVDNSKDYEVRCMDPNCELKGFVTKGFVAEKKNQEEASFLDAYVNLAGKLGLTSGKSTEELIKSIGF